MAHPVLSRFRGGWSTFSDRLACQFHD